MTWPPGQQALSQPLQRNIEALAARRHEEARATSRQAKLAEAITRFTGSMLFVYLHVAAYGAWIGINLGLIPGIRRFDPSFGMLSMEASVEAIFLSTFVLISQNRATQAADRRADLDLHINLLTEHELTKVAGLVAAIANKLEVPLEEHPELEDVHLNVAPEAVLDALDHQAEAASKQADRRPSR